MQSVGILRLYIGSIPAVFWLRFVQWMVRVPRAGEVCARPRQPRAPGLRVIPSATLDAFFVLDVSLVKADNLHQLSKA